MNRDRKSFEDLCQKPNTVLHVVSISSGKDSDATLAIALNRCPTGSVIPIFCDTGNEHEEVDRHLAYLERRHGIQVVRLKNDFSEEFQRKRMFIARDQRIGRIYDLEPVFEADGKTPVLQRDSRGCIVMKRVKRGGVMVDVPAQKMRKVGGGYRIRWSNKAKRRALAHLHPSGNPFLDLCMLKGRFPSRKAQFCTERLKTEMAVMFQLSLIDAGHRVVSWQGVRRDESDARRDAKKIERLAPRMWAFRPLVEWSAPDVFGYLAAQGLEPNPLYLQGMSRVGCMPCINAGKDEIREISVRFPGHVARISEWEFRVSQCSKRGFSTFFHKIDGQTGSPLSIFSSSKIDQVVLWSRTKRGGRQMNMLADFIDPKECSSAYGLCA